jgi:hypothetical protein
MGAMMAPDDGGLLLTHLVLLPMFSCAALRHLLLVSKLSLDVFSGR